MVARGEKINRFQPLLLLATHGCYSGWGSSRGNPESISFSDSLEEDGQLQKRGGGSRKEPQWSRSDKWVRASGLGGRGRRSIPGHVWPLRDEGSLQRLKGC